MFKPAQLFINLNTCVSIKLKVNNYLKFKMCYIINTKITKRIMDYK